MALCLAGLKRNDKRIFRDGIESDAYLSKIADKIECYSRASAFDSIPRQIIGAALIYGLSKISEDDMAVSSMKIIAAAMTQAEERMFGHEHFRDIDEYIKQEEYRGRVPTEDAAKFLRERLTQAQEITRMRHGYISGNNSAFSIPTFAHGVGLRGHPFMHRNVTVGNAKTKKTYIFESPMDMFLTTANLCYYITEGGEHYGNGSGSVALDAYVIGFCGRFLQKDNPFEEHSEMYMMFDEAYNDAEELIAILNENNVSILGD